MCENDGGVNAVLMLVYAAKVGPIQYQRLLFLRAFENF
jgi:hypothetical protein